MAVDARVDDGKLDMLVVRKCSIPEMMTLTAEIVAGKTVSHKKNVLYIQAQSIRVSADESLESDLDGECGPELPLTIETVPGALEIFC